MSLQQFNLEDRSPFDRRFFLAKDARLPDLDIQLLDGVTAVDLSTGTVTFSMEDRDGNVKVNAAAGVLVDGPTGKIRYQWAAADTDAVGDFIGQFVVTIGLTAFRIPDNTDQQLIITIGERVN